MVVVKQSIIKMRSIRTNMNAVQLNVYDRFAKRARLRTLSKKKIAKESDTVEVPSLSGPTVRNFRYDQYLRCTRLYLGFS